MSQLFQLEARASEVSLAGCVTPLVSEAASAPSVPDTSFQETAGVRERLESVQVCYHLVSNALGKHLMIKQMDRYRIFSFLILT